MIKYIKNNNNRIFWLFLNFFLILGDFDILVIDNLFDGVGDGLVELFGFYC